MAQAEHSIAFQLALDNVSHELDILARKALAIDEAMGEAISGEDTLEALPLELTQDVDLMRQSADCLHILVSNLAEVARSSSTPPEMVAAHIVTKGVYLSAIRDRVTAAPVEESVALDDLEGWIDL